MQEVAQNICLIINRNYLPVNLPLTGVIYKISQPIAHVMELFAVFAKVGFCFIYAHAVIVAGQVIDQRGECRWDIMEPLSVFFFYKCLAHTAIIYKFIANDVPPARRVLLLSAPVKS